MSTPPRPVRPRGRKVSVEIYFVLYLSAIILLLGTTHGTRPNTNEVALEDAVMQLLAPDFRVGADRAVMIYRFLPPGMQIRTAGLQLRRDSINVIRAVGSFADVRFQLVGIEDTSTGVSLPLDNAVLTRQGERTAIFSWRPRNVRENSVYRVTVRATATPLPPSTIVRPDVRAKIAEVLKRRGTISDSVSFTVNVFALNNPAVMQTGTQGPIVGDSGAIASSGPPPTSLTAPSGVSTGFEMTVAQPELYRAPKGAWRNRILFAGVGNAMNDLDLQVVKGSAQISERTPTAIELTGLTQSSGRQEIVVSGKRRSDGRTVQATFVVHATPIEAMKLPQVLYAGQTHALDLAPANIPGDQISVEVIENDRVVIPRSEGGSSINYRPAAVGRVRFVRYVGGDRLDQTEAEIRPLPAPTVVPQRQAGSSADEVIVQTISYGTVKGEPNRVQLKIQEGNADDPEELTAKYTFDDASLRHIQYWRVRRNGSGEFTFKAYALDRRGSNGGKSNPINFSALSGK